MADKTKIADMIIPEIFAPYVIERTFEQSAIIRSGLASRNEVLNRLITGGGKTITIPAYKSLTGRSQVLSDTTPLDTKKLSTKADIAAVLYRGNAWSINQLASALAGDNAYEALVDLVAQYWVEEEQRILIDILTGVFEATSMANLKAGDDNSYYDGDLIIDAQGKLGDAAGKLSGFIMHSAVRNDLLKKDKTAFQSWTERGIEYNKYLGYDVIVDDTCPVSAGVYTSYIFAKDAVSYGTGTPAGMDLVDTDKDILAGDRVLVNNKPLVLHVNGTKWAGTATGATPSDEELKTGTNWELVSDIKNIGIVQVKGKLGTAPQD